MDNQNNSQYQYTYYQNLYNSFGGYKPELDLRSKEIRRLSTLGGCMVIGFTVMQFVLVFAMQILGLYNLYQHDVVYQLGLSCILPIFYILLPAGIVYCIYKPEEKAKISIFDKPKSKELFLFSVFAGLMICTLGDFASNIVSTVASSAGLEFDSAGTLNPDSALSLILNFVAYAVLPPLVEELAFRGIIMQPLRKYGDKFAIFISAFLFALAHGTMSQIPFAFIAGIALGYFQVATGSIWTSVAIHCLNNLLATIISTYYQFFPNADNLLYYAIEGAILIIGIIAMVLYIKNKEYTLQKDNSEFTGVVKASTYLCSPAVILAVIITVNTSLAYTKVNSSMGISALFLTNVIMCILTICGAVKIHNDSRITYSGMYTASAVIICLATIFGSFAIMLSSLVVN